MTAGVDLGDGAQHFPGALPATEADALAQAVWDRANTAGWLAPKTPTGKPFSVRQVNFGPLGWISDSRGYRYEPHHPQTGAPWPTIPTVISDLWARYIGSPPPECCLVNHYDGPARMGLHRDADEEDMETPILSISLGQSARFRIGNLVRKGPTRSIILDHGDIVVMGGVSRRAYHGIDRLLQDDLFAVTALPFTGRLNLTLRRVSRAHDNTTAC